MQDYHFAEVAAPAGAPLLVLLHGTGGDETDLIGLGRQVLPGAHLVAPRGDVSEGGALRFFRRTGEGVYDMDDLARATAKLGAFMSAQVERLAPSMVAALGYSNGANVLASVLFSSAKVMKKVVLMHPLIPFAPPPVALDGVEVLVTAGRNDPIAPAQLTEELVRNLVRNGAETRLAWHQGGHELRPQELVAAHEFLTAPVRSREEINT